MDGEVTAKPITGEAIRARKSQASSELILFAKNDNGWATEKQSSETKKKIGEQIWSFSSSQNNPGLTIDSRQKLPRYFAVNLYREPTA